MGLKHSKTKAPSTDKRRDKTTSEKEKKEKKLKKNERKRRKSKKSKLDEVKNPEPPFVARIQSASNYDIEAKRRMQNQLAFDSETFVLNQLMLSIQFYGNYDREMWEAVERNRKQENEQNSKIVQHSKTVILPDRLYDAVDKRVKYYAKHGLNKNQLLPLHNQQLYIVHENIEITNSGETSDYSILTNAPVYKLEIEDPIENERSGRKKVINHVGYVKLKFSEMIKKLNDPMIVSESNSYSSKMINNHTNEDDIDDDDSGYTDVLNSQPPPLPSAAHRPQFRESVHLASNKIALTKTNNTNIYGGAASRNKLPNGYINGIPLSTTSTSSSTSPPSSEYDYAFITALNTHQPLSAMRSSNTSDKPLSTVILPDSCITEVISGKSKYNTYSTDDEDSTSASSTNESSSTTGSSSRHRIAEPQYSVCDEKQYLNSKAFLAYFINMFQETLAEDLNINKDDLTNATWKGSVIYSSKWEIIPAISGPWPREALEWKFRAREIHENPITRQKFQWPTPAMVNKVVGFGCHVIPHGFAPKNGINPQRDLEWKIVFPEAERYLESCLTATQAKVYLITKILFKTFVEPNLNSGLNMFTTEHIRAHLFWQCEKNYAAWPEDYLGEALIRFLNALLQKIQTKRLPDYFLPKRNLFVNIPEKILVELHRRIYRITESPVMHLLIALRNLTCIKDFYPKLKYKRLYSILIIDNPLKLINPKFCDNIAQPPSEELIEDYDNAGGSIAYFNKQEKRQRRRRTKVIRIMEAEKVRKEQGKNEERRDSVESFDTKFVFIKHMELVRRKLIYGIFINQFIEMAKVSCNYNSLNQALIYLKQAQRLCGLLSDDSEDNEADTYLQEISNLKTKISNKITENSAAPALPRRESMMEPTNRLRIRLTPSRTLRKNEDFDPYTNIDAIKSFIPEALDSDEEQNDIQTNSIVIADAQIHSQPTDSIVNVRFNGPATPTTEMTKIIGNFTNYEENDIPPPLPMKNEKFIKKKLLMQERELQEHQIAEDAKTTMEFVHKNENEDDIDDDFTKL